MNEQIKQLAEQAGLNFDGYGVYVPTSLALQETVKLQKLAELIIQECAKVCADNGMRAGGGNTIVGETLLDASKLIRGNFGLDTYGLY